MDLWHKIGSRSAADKDSAANIATLESVKDTLAANIMRGWLQNSLQKQLLAIEGKVNISQVKGSVSIVNRSEDKVIERSDLGGG